MAGRPPLAPTQYATSLPRLQPERAGDGGEEQVEGGNVDAVLRLKRGRDGGVRHRPRVRHDELTRQRDARALDAHQDGDPEIGQRGHDVDAEPTQDPDDLLNHASRGLPAPLGTVKLRSDGQAPRAGRGRFSCRAC